MSKILYQMGKYDNLTLTLLEMITEEVGRSEGNEYIKELMEDLNHFLSLDKYEPDELEKMRDKYGYETEFRKLGWR